MPSFSLHTVFCNYILFINTNIIRYKDGIYLLSLSINVVVFFPGGPVTSTVPGFSYLNNYVFKCTVEWRLYIAADRKCGYSASSLVDWVDGGRGLEVVEGGIDECV